MGRASGSCLSAHSAVKCCQWMKRRFRGARTFSMSHGFCRQRFADLLERVNLASISSQRCRRRSLWATCRTTTKGRINGSQMEAIHRKCQAASEKEGGYVSADGKRWLIRTIQVGIVVLLGVLVWGLWP